MMPPEGRDRPGVIAPPPLIFAIAFAFGILMRNRFPRAASRVLGGALTAIAMTIALFAAAAMFREHTHIDPQRPATALVTSGPFRFTRNPLYASLTLLYSGVALFFGILAAFVTLPLALLVLQFGVISREETYLEKKFGDRYRAYRSRVRRWI